MVIQLVGDNSSKSSKDFTSVVCYTSLGLGPYLGKGFELRTKHPNYLLKGSYENDCELLHPNHHGLPRQISCSFRVLVQKGISHTEIAFRKNKKNSFFLFPPCRALHTREEEILTYASNIISISILPSAWYIILIII